MLTADGPKVLEFNCRFGDPETQVLMARLDSDLLELLEATIDRRLHKVAPTWSPQAAVCVIMASGGYPGSYPSGLPITGLEALDAGRAVPFHAGTKRVDGELVTAGGRVLGLTALGEDVDNARNRAYEGVRRVHFPGAHYRTDIGAALAAR